MCVCSNIISALSSHRQLLCFETPWSRTFRHPAELVGDVFRCLVAIFKNEEKSVITPLLSTGDQVYTGVQIHDERFASSFRLVAKGLLTKFNVDRKREFIAKGGWGQNSFVLFVWSWRR